MRWFSVQFSKWQHKTSFKSSTKFCCFITDKFNFPPEFVIFYFCPNQFVELCLVQLVSNANQSIKSSRSENPFLNLNLVETRSVTFRKSSKKKREGKEQKQLSVEKEKLCWDNHTCNEGRRPCWHGIFTIFATSHADVP